MFGSHRSKKVGSGTRLGFETLETRSLLAATPLYAEPVYSEPVAHVSAAVLTVEEWVQTLNYTQFDLLLPEHVQYLTLQQVASIPHESRLASMSDAARAELNKSQVRAINTELVRIRPLTATQIGWLTANQIQDLGWGDFHLLSPAHVPYLNPEQVATIPGASEFSWWTDAAQAALTMPQVQALNVQAVFLFELTPEQHSWLTASQVHSLHYPDFQYLNAQQTPLLTTAQMASITHARWLSYMSTAARAALTSSQVQALDTSAVEIYPLTPQQIGWLAPAQIQKITSYDFDLLPPHQVPHLTPQQMAAVPSASHLLTMSDESQAALSRAQLFALPPEFYTHVTRSHAIPPSNYHPAVHTPVVTQTGDFDGDRDVDGHDFLRMQRGLGASADASDFADWRANFGAVNRDGPPLNHHAMVEAQKVLDLVPIEEATHVAVQSGRWLDPSTWSNGVVPSAGARVFIPQSTLVDFDAYMTAAIKTLRIDGVMRFVRDVNTQLKADTIVVNGMLRVGQEGAPIKDHVTARILIADGGPIDTRWDPNVISRGLINRGTLRMHGSYVTPYVALAGSVQAGDTMLTLESVPVNWKVGDELAVAGVLAHLPDLGTDRVRILAISGRTVTITPLAHLHDSLAGHGLSIQVANLTRNVELVAEDPSVVAQRPHLMFMHTPDVDIANVSIEGFGRTDKSVPINDPVVVNGVLQPGTGLNARARYAVHFHHTGVNPAYAPAAVRGSVVVGSPGWGFVNHQSNVIMEDNVAIDVRGASFVTEDGNEIGVMYRNLSLNATGVEVSPLSRLALHDFGFAGHGFWLQGPGVKLADNIVAGSSDAAYFYMTSSSKTMFDAVNLADPAQAAGRDAIPLNAVPLAEFTRNVAYNSKIGLEIWDHLGAMNDVRSYIDEFTAWNIRYAGIDLHYAGNIAIRNATLLGYYDYHTGYGVRTNWAAQNINFENVRAERFDIGIDVPVRGHSYISGGYFSTVQGLYMEKGQTTNRTVSVLGNIQFVRPGNMSELGGRLHYEIYLNGAIDFFGFKAGYQVAFDQDEIYVGRTGEHPMYLHFIEQLPGFKPFPSASASGYLPAEYLDRPNWVLWDEFGVAFNGGVLANGLERSGYFAFYTPAG